MSWLRLVRTVTAAHEWSYPPVTDPRGTQPPRSGTAIFYRGLMADMQTMVRTEISINGRDYFLAQGQDLDALRQAIEDASHSDGQFVDFVVVGNRTVSILVTPRTEVVISVETVQFDSRDTGDSEEPYGGFYDII